MKKTEQEKKPKSGRPHSEAVGGPQAQPGTPPDAAESTPPEQPAGAKAEAVAKPDAAAGAEQPGEETPGEAGNAEKPKEETGAGDKPAASDDGQDKAAPRAEDPGRGQEKAEQPDPEPETSSSGPPDSPASDAAAGELARLRAELLAARCLNAAYAAGVRPELAGDAATLAAAGAGPDGDAEKAVADILKRHPEWKAEEDGGKKKAGRTTGEAGGGPLAKACGGFKLGADPDKAAAKPAGGAGETTGKKRWNRFK